MVAALFCLQIVDKLGIRDVTPPELKGTPVPGGGLQPGAGLEATVVMEP